MVIVFSSSTGGATVYPFEQRSATVTARRVNKSDGNVKDLQRDLRVLLVRGRTCRHRLLRYSAAYSNRDFICDG